MGSPRDRRQGFEDGTDALAILRTDGMATLLQVAVVFAGCTIPPDDFPVAHPYPVAGDVARSGRDGVGVVCLCRGSGLSPLAAMMPILRKSVGGHRPQFPVKESIRFRCLAPASMLATLADDETV